VACTVPAQLERCAHAGRTGRMGGPVRRYNANRHAFDGLSSFLFDVDW
jgi:hypothetical protein